MTQCPYGSHKNEVCTSPLLFQTVLCLVPSLHLPSLREQEASLNAFCQSAASVWFCDCLQTDVGHDSAQGLGTAETGPPALWFLASLTSLAQLENKH